MPARLRDARHAAVSGRLRLLFDPAIEYRIYRTFPHGLAEELPRLRLPAGVICGRESAESRRTGLATTRRYFRVARIAGGHLFPFERPEAAAQAIREMAAELLGGA